MSQPMIGKPEIPSGTLIDNRYLIQRLLGQGGLGRTYLALDTRRFNEGCVLKEFAPRGSGAHSFQKSRDLFKREAEILYQIRHPQIPNFLACFEGDGRLFLVQEYVDGKTFSSILREYRDQGKAFSEEAVIDWLKKLLPVVDYVHQHDIIHRDISPDNIMLPRGGDLPVLIDFGVGKQVLNLGRDGSGRRPDDVEEVTYVGKMSLVGKIGYAPHEQIRLGICSPSSDLYALGVTAVVLLTCQDPYALMNQHSLKWQWRSKVTVSERFGQILDRMLADTPIERYQSAPEVLGDLRRLEEETLTEITSPSTIDPTCETLIAPPSTVVSFSPPQPERRNLYPKVEENSLQRADYFVNSIDEAFIQRCQDALSYYIGPMATFIVDEVLNSEPTPSSRDFVEKLAREIPRPQEALEFKHRVLD
ncbi:MAG: protein kinase [Nodosilinea sp.]